MHVVGGDAFIICKLVVYCPPICSMVNYTFSKLGLNVGCWYHGNKQAYYGNVTLCQPCMQTNLALVLLSGWEIDGRWGGVEYIGQDDERGDESVCVYVYYMCVTDQDRKTSNGQIDFRQSKTRQKDKVMWEQDSIDRKNRSV